MPENAVNRLSTLVYLPFLFVSDTWSSVSAEDFSHQQNVVYAEEHGVALVMDIFTPTGPKNGLGIVDVISGAWHSDRSKIAQHMLAQAFTQMCRKGYTVFAIRPGSITKFNATEMRDHLNLGILWVKRRAKDYSIDRDPVCAKS